MFNRFYFLMYTGWTRRYFSILKGELLGKVSLVGPKYICIEDGVKIHDGVQLQAIIDNDIKEGRNLKEIEDKIIIGKNTIIQRDSQISASNRIVIGENVVIADRTLIIDTTHGDFTPNHYTFTNGSTIPDVFLGNVYTRPFYSSGPVIIEDNVHIGMNCVIMPGVKIGRNSIISASTVVMKDVPPFSIVSSMPGKLTESFSD